MNRIKAIFTEMLWITPNQVDPNAVVETSFRYTVKCASVNSGMYENENFPMACKREQAANASLQRNKQRLHAARAQGDTHAATVATSKMDAVNDKLFLLS